MFINIGGHFVSKPSAEIPPFSKLLLHAAGLRVGKKVDEPMTLTIQLFIELIRYASSSSGCNNISSSSGSGGGNNNISNGNSGSSVN